MGCCPYIQRNWVNSRGSPETVHKSPTLMPKIPTFQDEGDNFFLPALKSVNHKRSPEEYHSVLDRELHLTPFQMRQYEARMDCQGPGTPSLVH